MDAKLTLSLDAKVIESAKVFAEEQGISLSRLIEVMLRKAINTQSRNIEDLPISEWVMQVAEGEVEYKTRKRSRKEIKDEYFSSKK